MTTARVLAPGTSGPRGRWARVRPPVLLAGLVLAVSVALHLRDPHRPGSWAFCPWLVLTGTYCPGCGGLRAVNDLTRGDLRAAASSNLLLVGSLPLALFVWVRWVRDAWTGRRRTTAPRRLAYGAVGFAVLAAVFTVLRNTSYGAWLAP